MTNITMTTMGTRAVLQPMYFGPRPDQREGSAVDGVKTGIHGTKCPPHAEWARPAGQLFGVYPFEISF